MRNYTVTRVWGIPIRINISLIVFLPILAWLIGSGTQLELYAGVLESVTGRAIDAAALQEGSTPWVIGIAAAVGLFVSVTLHELGHAYAALRYGIGVESITLWILGGLASLESFPKEWNREFVIALAGPAASVLVGAVAFGSLSLVPASAPVAVFVIGWVALANVLLTVFNLLPAFPMDGGRVLRSLLARNRSHAEATQIAAGIGRAFGIAFAIFGVLFFAPMFLLLAWFIYSAASAESRIVQLESLLDGYTVADILPSDRPQVDADSTLTECIDVMLDEKRTTLPVVENGQYVGLVTMGAIQGVDAVERDAYRVEDVLTHDLPTFDATTTGFDALTQLGAGRKTAAYVTRDGERVGVIDHSDFASLLNLQKQLRTPTRRA
jgi:Zn-dependent protease